MCYQIALFTDYITQKMMVFQRFLSYKIHLKPFENVLCTEPPYFPPFDKKFGRQRVRADARSVKGWGWKPSRGLGLKPSRARG